MTLVTGASGFVGAKIMEMCEGVIAAQSLRGVSEDEVRRVVKESGCDTIIHTAAISDIGACERDPEGSYTANVLLPIYLARAASEEKIKLVCFSSDQVYSGHGEGGPFSEEMVKPSNLYSRHKLEMENRVLDICPDSVMLRAEWMYDYYLKKSNYFMNMISATGSVAYSSQQFRGVTYVKEVCEQMENVCRLPGGAYNFGSETKRSMHEITKEFLSKIGRNVSVLDAPSRENLWMDCSKARAFGVEFSSVEMGLERCARDYGYLI
ncbi:MAG: sugar nucleotide-binding protein [Clostridia bacterium]|nr:sugar nucleotide-binding protein [Clostridia bacterium]